MQNVNIVELCFLFLSYPFNTLTDEVCNVGILSNG